MTDFAAVIAGWMQVILPGWVRLPALTFVMPHWLYWVGLIVFPLIAIHLVRRAETATGRQDRVSASIAYLLWLWGGIMGLHRFYLRSARAGLAYIVLFVTVLYGNRRGAVVRNLLSDAQNGVRDAEFEVGLVEKAIEKGGEGLAAKLESMQQALQAARQHLGEVTLLHDQWGAFVGAAAAAILILLIVDAVLMPRLVRTCRRREPADGEITDFTVMERGPPPDPRRDITNPFIRFVELITGWSGRLVAYWAIIAVFVYYYEVIARYVFNSPTNWAHESMFLMFGMQYLLAGGYALREGAHVRVDVIYERFSPRTRALIDIVSSFFFFVFAATLLVTGYFFARDSIDVWEVSFTEWAIQYWPVKITIVLGAALLLAQGAAKLTRDIIFFRRGSTG